MYGAHFAHSIPCHSRPVGRPHLTWVDTTMHDVGSLGHTLQIGLLRDWVDPSLYRDVLFKVGGGLSCQQS